MHAKRGGLAVQRRYRMEGREPTAKATDARRAIYKLKTREADRARRGLPATPRTWHLPI